MQLLYVSTRLDILEQSLEPSFYNSPISLKLKDFNYLYPTALSLTIPTQDLLLVREVLSEITTLHYKAQCYKLLTPSYYIYLRLQICKLHQLFTLGKILQSDYSEMIDKFRLIHNFALSNLSLLHIDQLVREYKIEVELKKQDPSISISILENALEARYDANLELSYTHKPKSKTYGLESPANVSNKHFSKQSEPLNQHTSKDEYKTYCVIEGDKYTYFQ
jgi:hypothetical protein